MFGIRKNLFDRLKRSLIFRRAYVQEQIKQGVPAQIRAMREARNLKQTDVAQLTGKAQSNIARLEDPNYGKFTLTSLLEIAEAFDVWLSVEFVSFAEGLRRTEKIGQAALNARSFSDADKYWNIENNPIHIEISTNTGNKIDSAKLTPIKVLENLDASSSINLWN